MALNKYVILYSRHQKASRDFKNTNNTYQAIDWDGDTPELKDEYCAAGCPGASRFPMIVDTETKKAVYEISDMVTALSSLASMESDESDKIQEMTYRGQHKTTVKPLSDDLEEKEHDQLVLDIITCERMKADPSAYSSKGVKAWLAKGAFAKGDALDTDQKITDYADACLADIDDKLADRAADKDVLRQNLESI